MCRLPCAIHDKDFVMWKRPLPNSRPPVVHVIHAKARSASLVWYLFLFSCGTYFSSCFRMGSFSLPETHMLIYTHTRTRTASCNNIIFWLRAWIWARTWDFTPLINYIWFLLVVFSNRHRLLAVVLAFCSCVRETELLANAYWQVLACASTYRWGWIWLAVISKSLWLWCPRLGPLL